MIYVGIDPSLESSAMFLFDDATGDHEYHSFYVTHTDKLPKKKQHALDTLQDAGVFIHRFVDLVDRSKVKHAKQQAESNTKKQADVVCSAIKDILKEGSSIEELNSVLDQAHTEDLEVYKLMAENELSRYKVMHIVAQQMLGQIMNFCFDHNSTEVTFAIEAPAYVATGSSSVDLIAGCAFVRNVPNLLRRYAEYRVNNTYMLPPTSVKKHATGRGTAEKDEMCASFTRKGPNDAFRKVVEEVDPKDYKPMDDIVDAYFMAYFVAEDKLSKLS